MSRFLLLMIGGLGALAAAVLFAQGERERGLAAGEDTWVAAAPMPTPRLIPEVVRLPDGRVLVVGGYSGGGLPPTPVIYNPTSDSWTGTTSGWTTAYVRSVTRLGDGRVLVTTFVPGDATNKARIFNPATNAWTAAASPAYERANYTATLRADGTVVLIGGFDAMGAPMYVIEKYTPSTNAWSIEPAPNRARYEHTATALPDGSVLVVGGTDGANNPSPAERYVPGNWIPAGTAAGRFDHTATLMWDGRVLVVGGRGFLPGGGNPQIDPEVYDPATNTWSPAGVMKSQGHTATLLPSGLVLIAGGTETWPWPMARVFIPSANDWAWVAEPVARRERHAAALLADGTVLVTGGQSDSGLLASSEIYTPPSSIPPPNTPTTTPHPTDTGTPTPTNTPGGPPNTSTPTFSPTSSIQDSDGDGCRDNQEIYNAPQYGGLRDPYNPHDFYDVDSTRKIDGVDIGLVRSRFNASGPLPPGDEIYDRSPGTAEWAPGPPDGVINAVDIGLIRASFNHSCQ